MRALRTFSLVAVAHLAMSLAVSTAAGLVTLGCLDRPTPCGPGESIVLAGGTIAFFPVVEPLSNHLPGYNAGIGYYGLAALNSLLWATGIVVIVHTWRRVRRRFLSSPPLHGPDPRLRSG